MSLLRKRIVSGAVVLASLATSGCGYALAGRGNFLPGWGYGFGLGFAVRLDRGQAPWIGNPGEYFWGGYAGTFFFVDPELELVPILMFQAPEKRAHYRVLFRDALYQAIIK